jgi:hypothetical protein
MTRDILGVVFTFVASIEPDRNSCGDIFEFMPQSKYWKARGLALNRHGQGPFCQFRIPTTFPYQGVYAIVVDGEVAYVGQCQNLSERFNERGYGTIHPRNCFEQGQATNCKVNHLILESAKRGRRIDLWFHGSAAPDEIEEHLISN